MPDNIWQVPRFIAHRGASAFAPENTLVALQKAAELGATWVEFDVQLTADDEVVVFHDYTVNRTTDGDGLLASMNYDELTYLDAGSWFSNQFSGEAVPSLAEYLSAVAAFELGINVELKATDEQAESLAQYVLLLLGKHWSAHLPEPLISSANSTCLQALHQIDPTASLGYIVDRWQEDKLPILENYNCMSCHLNEKYLTAQQVAAIKAIDRHVLAYTVNTQERATELFAMGVEGVFSDCLFQEVP